MPIPPDILKTISLDPRPAAVSGIVSIRPDPELKVLRVGSILPIEILPDNKGELGVLLNGKFYSALLPDNSEAGKRLFARVVANGDSVVLKLVTEPLKEAPRNLPVQLPDLMASIFPSVKFDSIKETDYPAKTLLTDLRNVLKNTTSAQSDIHTIVKYLVDHSLVASDKELETPKEMSKFLLGLTQVYAAPKEALEKVHSFIAKHDSLPTERQFSLISLVQSTLENILAQDSPLSFELQSDSDATPSQIANLIAKYIFHSDKQGMEAATKELGQTLKGNLLGTLLSVLGLNLHDSLTATDSQSTATLLLEGVLRELIGLRASSAPDGEIRQKLRSLLKEVSDYSLSMKAGKISTSPIESQLLRALENLAQAQETLNTMNPIMNSAGEPSLIMFPVFIQGLLYRWAISFLPTTIEGKEEKARDKTRSPYQQLSLRLEFPSIGVIGVSLAHNKSEIFIDITTSKSEISDFIKSKEPLFESLLSAEGFNTVGLKVTAGDSHDLTPLWVKELSKRSIVA